MKWAVLAVALLTGCAGPNYLSVTTGSRSGGIAVHASTTTNVATLGLLLGLVVIALSTSDLEGIGNPRADPELDPSRPVSEQDCSQPIDYSKGNIRCK